MTIENVAHNVSTVLFFKTSQKMRQMNETEGLTSQMGFLGLSVNACSWINHEINKESKIYNNLPDQLRPMVTFSADSKNTQKVGNAQQQQLCGIRAMQ